MEDFMTLNIIIFADMARRENDEVSWDVSRVLVIKLIWHSYLILNLGSFAHETSSETGFSSTTHVEVKHQRSQ
jgi:hypothetical protein